MKAEVNSVDARLQCHAARFPYAIYYKILDGEAVVFRVLDCRRDPRTIADELTSSH